MSRKCQRIGCTEDASCVVKINVPAKGHAIDTHQPIAMIIGLYACKPHFDKLRVEEFLKPQIFVVVNTMTVSRGLEKPDFDRAWLSAVPLDSKEFSEFEGLISTPKG